MTSVLQVNRNQPAPGPIREACQVLQSGGLVIVPTETVYGIACDPAVEGAMEALVATKGRDGSKPIARLAADAAQAAATALNWTPGLQALSTTYWPGPLTIVLETDDGWTGFRVPDHPVAIALARACGRSLALTSANLSGDPDPRTAREAMASVQADLALDSGPSAEAAIPSTVIKVGRNTLECLREGGLPFADVEKTFKAGSRL